MPLVVPSCRTFLQGAEMLTKTGSSGLEGQMKMAFDLLSFAAAKGKTAEKKEDAAPSTEGSAPEKLDGGTRGTPSLENGSGKKASIGLGKLESSSKSSAADTTREGGDLKQKHQVESAKLEKKQKGESAKLYGDHEKKKTEFFDHQKVVKDKFLAKKPSKEQIHSFEATQAADKKKFEAELVGENVALYKKHKAETSELQASQQKESKALEAKYTPAPKPMAAKPKFTAAAKTEVVEIAPVICKKEDAEPMPVQKIDGMTPGLVYIAA